MARIAGVDDRAAAEALRGHRLYVPREALPRTGDEEYYHADLIGLACVRDDGTPLFGGLVICEYLDSFNATAPLFPKDETRWMALRQMVTGDGIFDATTLIRIESWRDKDTWHLDYMRRERRKIFGALDMLEEDAKAFSADVFHIGHVCIAGGLSYLNLRNPIRDAVIEPGDDDWDWRAGRPTLSAWFDEILKRPSVAHKVELPK